MKHLLYIIFLSFSFSSSIAQGNPPGKKAERVQALKVAFITQKLELTTDEAQKFWPVYNQYETELKQVIRSSRGGGDVLENEEKVLNLKKKYKSEFIKAVGEQKTTAFYNAEREFRGVLLRQLKNRQAHQKM